MTEARSKSGVSKDSAPADAVRVRWGAFLPVLLVGLILRLIWVSAIPTLPVDDCSNYYQGGVSIVSGEGYVRHGLPTARRPVGYSAFLAALFRITGPSYLLPKIANVVFAALTLAILYALLSRLFDEVCARWTCWALAVMPSVFAYVNCISTEVIFRLLLVAMLWLICRAWGRGFWVQLGLTGVLLGYAILVRGTALYLAPLLAFLVWRKQGAAGASRGLAMRRGLAALGLWIAIALIMAAPWLVRNYRLFGRPLLTNYAGWNLYYGNNQKHSGYQTTASFALGRVYKRIFDPESDAPTDYRPLTREDTREVDEQITVRGVKREMVRDDALKKRALEWIKANPRTFLKLGAIRVFRFFRPDNCGIGWSALETTRPVSPQLVNALKGLTYLIHPVIIVGFLIYLARTLSRPREWGEPRQIGLLLIIYFAAISFVLIGHGRYHFAVAPFTIAYAVTGYRSLRPGRGTCEPE